MQAKQDQQAVQIAKLQAHQSQAAQPSVIAACQGQSGDRSGAGQTPTVLHPHLHREQERSSVDAGSRMASIIRYASEHSQTAAQVQSALQTLEHENAVWFLSFTLFYQSSSACCVDSHVSTGLEWMTEHADVNVSVHQEMLCACKPMQHHNSGTIERLRGFCLSQAKAPLRLVGGNIHNCSTARWSTAPYLHRLYRHVLERIALKRQNSPTYVQPSSNASITCAKL